MSATPPRVAIATCAEVAELDADGQALVDELGRLGAQAVPAVWDDPEVAWGAFDVVVVRSTWDYAERRKAYLAWAEAVACVTRLVNPVEALRWNTDKRYLADLAARGVPVVPTAFVEPGQAVVLPTAAEFVIKPAVSAGARDTARYAQADADLARAHAEALLAAGRPVALQPYLETVDRTGETALVYLDGRFSHALRKGPLLERGGGPVEGLFAVEDITARVATPAQRAVGDRALAEVQRRFGTPAYARVDLLPGPGAAALLLELELTEPSLFLAEGGASAAPLAAALLRELPR